MTRIEPLRVLWRWRMVVAAGVAVGLAVGWVSAPGKVTSAPSFQATHTLIADPQGGDAYIYRAAATAKLGVVPGRVASRLGLDRPVVQAMVSTETPVGVGLLLITGRSRNREQAEALANVTAEELIAELGGPKSPLQTLERAVAMPVPTDDIKGPASHRGRALLLGAFGLLLGIGAAFAVERFDNRIRTKRTAEAAFGVPVVAEVPLIPRPERGRLQTGAQPSAFVEAYRGLRISVERWTDQGGPGDGHRVVLVTSAVGGEGKTTTVAQLAVTLGEIGHSVLVISADLRRPRLHDYFDRPREPGLTDVLRGAPDVRRVTDLNLATTLRGVRFVASGAPVDDPGPLLERAGEILGDARGLADFVLVDVPPLLTSGDAAQLAHHADGVLLVVRDGRTSTGAAARSAEQLELLGIPVIGAVLVAGENRRSRGGWPKARFRTSGHVYRSGPTPSARISQPH